MDKETYEALKRLIEREKKNYFDLPVPEEFDIVEAWIEEYEKEVE